MDKKIWNFNTFDDSFKDDLRVFVGPRVDTYIKRWTAMGHRKNKMISLALARLFRRRGLGWISSDYDLGLGLYRYYGHFQAYPRRNAPICWHL